MPATSNLLALALAGSDGVAAERCAACVVQVIETSRRIYAGLEQRSRALLADPACTPAQRLWLQEMSDGQQAQQRIFAELAKFTGRPAAAEARSSTTVAVVQFLTLHVTGIVGGFDARIGWVTRLASAAGAGGGGGRGGGGTVGVPGAPPAGPAPRGAPEPRPPREAGVGTAGDVAPPGAGPPPQNHTPLHIRLLL